MITATVIIDLGPLKKFKVALENDLRRSANGHIRAAFKKWAARYRAFLRERFSIQSRGGGEWPPLALSTQMAGRRGKLYRKARNAFLRGKLQKFVSADGKVKSKRVFAKTFVAPKVAILIDTGTLFGSLDPVFKGKPGQYEEDVDYGIAVGYGNRSLHPSGNKAALTVEDIAMFHQRGGRNLPQRKIIVPPDQATMDGMAKDMQTALERMIKETGNN